ncbi:MAG: metal ABC transporter solute-binding protein, Zn/Mn family [Aggregatilineales bacterium]
MKFRTALLSCLLMMITLIPVSIAQDNSLTIVASHSILADVVSNVAGDSAEVVSLIPSGGDPHSFSPSTGDLTVLADASVVFINGANFEEGLLDAIENAAVDMKIVEASTCVDYIAFGAAAHNHSDEEHSDEDHDSMMSEACEKYHEMVDAMYGDMDGMDMDMSDDDNMDMDMSDDDHDMHSSGTNSAIYLSITNNTGSDDALVGVSSEFANLFEIHETTVEDDVAMMREREGGIDVPAGETVTLQPGGLHIMVMNLQTDLTEGDRVEVMLEFASGTMLNVTVPIAEFEEDAPEMTVDAEGFVITTVRGRPAAAGTAMDMDVDHNHDDDADHDHDDADHDHDDEEDHDDDADHDHDDDADHDHSNEGCELGHDDHSDESDSEAGDEHNHEDGACDPHVWMDVHNVMLWTLTIRDTLIDADPANADTYTANADAYLSELTELGMFIDMQLNSIPEDQRILLTNHDSFGYLAVAYDFEIIDTVLPGGSTLAEPSAADMAALIETVRSHNVTAIFAETTASTDIAAQIADETGITLYTLYSGALSEADGNAATYLDYMRYNIETIVTALSQ